MNRKFFLIILIVTWINFAHAGGVDGGGGGAFVCRDNQGQMLNSELLDLWEAQKLDKLNIERSDLAINIQIENAISKLDPVLPSLANKLRTGTVTILTQAEALPSDIDLAVPSDTNSNYRKPGCPLEGMMFYDGNIGKVFYKLETFNKLLSNTDKAAIWVHESVYKLMREEFLNKNSINSRKLVGCLFSNNCNFNNTALTIDELLKADLNKAVFKCTDKNIEYFASGEITPTGPIWNGQPRNHFNQSKVYITKYNNLIFNFPVIEGEAKNPIYPDSSTPALVYQSGLEKYGIYLGFGYADIIDSTNYRKPTTWGTGSYLISKSGDGGYSFLDCAQVR